LEDAVRPVAGVVGMLAFGWALVAAADARHEQAQLVVYTDVIVHRVEVDPVDDPDVETPYADSLVDWDELDRQTECLWTLLQDAGVDLTLEVVLAAGTWSDALGGACLMIGEDDE
jgi:hypothetical protein